MPKFTVSVTADDIAKGVRQDEHACPIRRALARTCWPHFHDFYVLSENIYIEDGSEDEVAIPLPPSAGEFIEVFDGTKDGTPSPFDFEIDVPADLLAGEA